MKTKPPKDYSETQMRARLAKAGIKPDGCGYWNIGNGVCVYARNGGTRRRHQVHYLLQQQEKEQEQQKESSNPKQGIPSQETQS